MPSRGDMELFHVLRSQLAARGIHLLPPPRRPWESLPSQLHVDFGLRCFRPPMDTLLRLMGWLFDCDAAGGRGSRPLHGFGIRAQPVSGGKLFAYRGFCTSQKQHPL